MLKKLAILGGVLVMFLTGCGSDGDSKSARTEDTPIATAAAEKTPEATKASGPVGGPSVLLQPLTIMGGPLFGGDVDLQATPQEVDPGLKAALLTEDDLPPDYAGYEGGEFAYSFDSPEGPMEMAARMFFKGDVMQGGKGSVVMSAAMSMPASAFEEWETGLAEVEDLDPEKVEEIMGQTGLGAGIKFSRFEVSRIDLGEGGMRMAVVVDMSGLAESLGEEMGMFEGGIGFDMYIFKSGLVAYMLMNMWPADEPSDIDSAALARVMESRAP